MLKTAGVGFLIISAVLFSILSALLIICKNKGAFILFLLLALFCVRSVTVINSIEKINKLDGIDDTVEVTVVSTQTTPEQGNVRNCTAKVKNSFYLNKNTTVSLVLFDAKSYEIGDSFTALVSYQKIDGDLRHTYFGEGVYIKAVVKEEYGETKTQNGIYSLAGKLRRHITSRILNNTDNSHVLMAVLTGDKAYMSDKFYDTVKCAGVSHILVVSGMHMAIICVGLERILRLIIRNKFIQSAITLLFVFFMCVLFGMSMSVIRAGIVYLIRAVYNLMGRNVSNLHSLAFAALTVIFIHPFALHSVVFRLSYASTLGILVLPQLFDEKFKDYTKKSNILRVIANAFYVSVSAYITTLPICISVFGYVSVVSVLCNVLVSLAATYMLSFTVLAVVFGFIPIIERTFYILADMLADYFVKMVDFFGSLSFSTVSIRNPELLTALLLISYLILYIIIFKPYKFLKRGEVIADR
jgi:competence protein ComEC